MNSIKVTRWFIYLLIFVAVAAIIWSYNAAGSTQEELAISELAAQVQNGEIDELSVSGEGREVTVSYKNDNRQDGLVMISNFTSLEEVLGAYGITPDAFGEGKTTIVYEQPSQWGGLLNSTRHFLAGAPDHRFHLLHYAPGPGQQQSGLVLRQEPGADVYRRPSDRHL